MEKLCRSFTRLVHMFKELHCNTKSRTIFTGEHSEEVVIDNGAKQSVTSAPTLFVTYFITQQFNSFQN